jgi:hypothetical protein
MHLYACTYIELIDNLLQRDAQRRASATSATVDSPKSVESSDEVIINKGKRNR